MAITYLSGQRIQGRTYTSWDFDGSNDYVQLTEKFNFLHNGNNGSIAVWIYMTDYPSSVDGAVFDTHGGQSTSVGVAFGIRQSSGKLYANILADGDSWYVAESASAITKDAWHHVVYTYDGSDINLYLDGNSTPVGTVSAGSPKTASATFDAVLGKQIVTGYTDGFYNGLCDQLLIYDDILTTGEISALYNSGNADHTPNESNLQAWYNFEQTGSTLTDQTSNGYDGTNNGATTGATGVFPDDKATVTDVPVGSQFEETDTRKFYQRSAGSTTRALGDVVWDASESQDATISGNDVYFDNGDEWNVWSRSTDTFTMGDGLATVIWNPHSVATSTAQHTMVGFGKDPISASSAIYDNIEFYQYIESNSTYRAFQINTSDTVPAVNMGNLSGTLTTSTILKITMDINGQVKYYIDLTGGGTFVLYATSTRNATAGTYYIHVTGKQLGGADNVTYSVIKDPAWVERGTAI